jgi:hypothetical protein
MSKQVQYRRGTTVEHNSFVGAEGEMTIDTTKNVPIIHDGATSGGFPVQPEHNLQLQFTVGNGVDEIQEDDFAITRCPFKGVIGSIYVVSFDYTGAAVSGSCSLDLRKDTYANFPPTEPDSLSGTASITLSSQSKATYNGLVGTEVNEGDYLFLAVESASSVKALLVSVSIQPIN